jgi:YgiT-type zinc finger domain-containing protein
MSLTPEFIAYGECFYCGGGIEERLLPREIRWKGELRVFEEVPVGVCVQCGEKFLRPEVAKKIDAALRSKKRPTRTLQVPVYYYQIDVA